MLRDSMAQLAQWRAAGHAFANCSLSVNVGTRQLEVGPPARGGARQREARSREHERPHRILARYALPLLLAGLFYVLYRCVPS